MTRFLKIVRDAVFVGAFLVLASLIIGKLDLSEDTVISGPFFAIDGDTLAAGAERLRLIGIDAPEADQTCGDGQGGRWRCGYSATQALSHLAADASVTCRGDARDKYKRILVRCRRGETDVNADLVRQGMAVASGAYKSEETAAREGGRGIWAGPFETPRAWRTSRGAMDDETAAQTIFDWLKDVLAW